MDQSELDELKRQLADYFCEDVATFQLDDCIATFNTFIQQFIKAADVRSPTRSRTAARGVTLHVKMGVVRWSVAELAEAPAGQGPGAEPS